MSGLLSEPVRIFDLASRGIDVDESVGILRFPRLAGILAVRPRDEDVVRVGLAISEASDCAVIRGRIRAELSLQCQRCLAPMLFAVDHEVGIVIAESAAVLAGAAEELEPVLLEDCRADGIARGEGRDTTIKLAPLIEDELMLAVPLAPVHDESEHCEAPLARTSPDSETGERVDNPFAALAALKKEHD